jgi:hypothetical protein
MNYFELVHCADHRPHMLDKQDWALVKIVRKVWRWPDRKITRCQPQLVLNPERVGTSIA